jgi:hypothetical protein
VKIPSFKLEGASAVAVGLYDPRPQGEWLVANKGERDRNNSRLIIPLRKSASPMRVSGTAFMGRHRNWSAGAGYGQSGRLGDEA